MSIGCPTAPGRLNIKTHSELLRWRSVPLSRTINERNRLVAALPAEEYTLGPDSQRHDGVPKGTVTKHTWTSKIFPGTVRDYWIYVPTQYRLGRPAPFMVFQDGGGFVTETGSWRAPIVFDNLIHKKEMPVTIGIFINPGNVPASSPDTKARSNR